MGKLAYRTADDEFKTFVGFAYRQLYGDGYLSDLPDETLDKIEKLTSHYVLYVSFYCPRIQVDANGANIMQDITFRRCPEARAKFANMPNASWYESISEGLMTGPVKLGSKVSVWPEHELNAIASARLAGADDEAVRKLVADLMAARKSAGQALATHQ